jgi:phenylacetate-CoA ligase
MPLTSSARIPSSREELEQLQLERLQATLHRVERHVAFYRRIFKEIGFDPDQFASLADLKKLPFTTEDDLSEAYPYAMFATPLKEVVRIHTSSGRKPNPIVLGYTEKDLRNSALLLARIFSSLDLNKEDVFQITLNYGLGTGAFAFHEAARELGASTIPTSTGHTEKQVLIMRDFGTSCLVATPGYALKLLRTIEEKNITPASLRLKALLLTGEPWSAGVRHELEEGFQTKAYDFYGLSAVLGPVVAAQCLEQEGLHIQEDVVHAEIIDPQTGQNLEAGQWGELVLSTLVKESVPLLRYRTGDRARFLAQDCPCAIPFQRIEQVPGRIDDVLIIKGINIAPERLNDLLCNFLGQEVRWQAQVEGDKLDQQLVLRIGITEKLFFDQMKEQRTLVDNLRRTLSQWLGVTPQILFVEPDTLE